MIEESGRPPVFFGRRRGRSLRRRKSALIAESLSALAIERPQPGAVLEPRSLFPGRVGAVWLEIGFGGGEHTAWQAAHHPDIGLIGCEPFVNGVANLLMLVEDGGLTNVRILPDDARPLLDALPEASIGRCFVLFADPWPKARHRERRFIGPENLPRLARVLEDGAELRLASDDPGLVDWMLDQVWHHPDFEWLARSAEDWRQRPEDWPETRYEAKARAAGRQPVFLRFRRRPRG